MRTHIFEPAMALSTYMANQLLLTFATQCQGMLDILMSVNPDVFTDEDIIRIVGIQSQLDRVQNVNELSTIFNVIDSLFSRHVHRSNADSHISLGSRFDFLTYRDTGQKAAREFNRTKEQENKEIKNDDIDTSKTDIGRPGDRSDQVSTEQESMPDNKTT